MQLWQFLFFTVLVIISTWAIILVFLDFRKKLNVSDKVVNLCMFLISIVPLATAVLFGKLLQTF